MLGFSVSQATVSRYMPAASRRPGQSWRTFLCNQARAFRADRDSENVSGVEYRSLHAWLYRSGLVRLAVAQIALVGTRRGRCGGSPLTLPNAERISLRSVQYDRGVWPVIVVRLLYRCAVHSMRRGRRHDRARRQFGPRRIASKCSGRLTRLPTISASAEFELPARGLSFEKGQPNTRME
jgi:hypothetical protein